MTVDEVVERIDADRDFYRNSGGGVTISGGEPLAQPAFLAALALACRERGLHVAIETSGHAPEKTFQEVAPLFDLFLFDIKVVDSTRHAALTGVGNADILANLAWLAAIKPRDVIVRFAVIPGYTDDEANLNAVSRLMRQLGLTRLELEAYHPLGGEKYEALGWARRCSVDATALDGDRLAELVERFSRPGVDASLV